MHEETVPVDRCVAALLAAQPPPADHRGPDELFAYLAGELAPTPEDRLQAHLEDCRECSALLLDLEPLAAPATDAAADVVDLEAVAAWRATRARLEEFTRLPSGGRQHPTPAPRWLYALAAALLLGVLGLSGWGLQLSRTTADLRATVAHLSAPQVNVPVLYLESTRGESDASVVPADGHFFVLMVSPPDPRDFESYSVEILDAAGGTAWSGAGLKLSDHGSLRLGLSRSYLPAEEYRLRLFGVTGQSSEQLAEYPLRLRLPR